MTINVTAELNKKTGTPYTIEVSPELRSMLSFYIDHARDQLLQGKQHDFVFVKVSTGAPLTSLYTIVRNVVYHACGIQAGMYVVRVSDKT